MKTFLTLIRREFWEERGAFLTTPIVIGAVMIVLAILAISTSAVLVEKVNGEEFFVGKLVEGLQGMEASEVRLFWDINLFGLAAIFNVALFFVVFFYLLGSLYDDRKDRSFLFWKSMPVSDIQTVLSKLFAATLLAPLLMVLSVAATELILMVIGTLLLWNADLSPWDYLWGPAEPLRVWSLLLASYLVQALWMLPVWGWLILASAFARSKPFLWAVVPPVLFAIMQSWFNLTQYLRWDNNWMWKLLGERFLGGAVPLALVFEGGDSATRNQILRFENGELVEGDAPMTFGALVSRLGEGDLWWGVIVGTLFITAAIFIRRWRDDS
jgi:ABC-2 type transport system permease protein